MAPRKPATQTGKSASPAAEKTPPAAPAGSYVPLEPRPKLLALMALTLAAWVGFLVFLYFRTPRPVHAVPGTDAAETAPETSVGTIAAVHTNRSLSPAK
jgi:hypothetical protein